MKPETGVRNRGQITVVANIQVRNRGHYLLRAKKADITKGEISEVLAKVMAVAAGQKRLQAPEVMEKYGINLQSFE